ncbi:MAG: exodeoxyribonuclease VII large subunit [Kofleriaceae bacterium]|nr:exodeoxyribonuclease VII large subunit [Kofleriaceae bacterium]
MVFDATIPELPGLALTGTRERPLGVGDVLRLAGRTLEGVGSLWLEAEVSQVSTPASGHLYLAIRDRDAVMPAVLWKREAERLGFRIEVGMRLRLRGRLSVYDRDGKMQLYIDSAEPAGLGAAALALEQLKQKLQAEGLFATARKRPLPRFPQRIGVVTSKNGAAVHDIIRTVNRRFPTPIAVADCLVQGPLAPNQIVDAMVLAVKAGCDVIILGRGGGAAMDLSAFNNERLVRTVSRCPVPVISAVGHEVDVTLCDLVADQRASTPTAAAELAVPVAEEIREVLIKERRRLDREVGLVLNRGALDLDNREAALRRAIDRVQASAATQLAGWQRRLMAQHPRTRLLAQQTELATLERRLAAAGPRAALTRAQHALTELAVRIAAQSPIARIAHERAELASLQQRAASATQHQLDVARGDFATQIGKLSALSPLAVMERGFAMVRHHDAIVRRSDSVAVGEQLHVQLSHGALTVEVRAVLPAPSRHRGPNTAVGAAATADRSGAAAAPSPNRKLPRSKKPGPA